MKKRKLLALLLAGSMTLSLAACGGDAQGNNNTPSGNSDTPSGEGKTVKVGLICIGDENDQGYTYNFIRQGHYRGLAGQVEHRRGLLL